MAEGHSTKVVLTSLAGNVAITIAKFAAAYITHSGSMMAEAIHTSSDCLNQILLLVGLRQAQVGASEKHPLGTGRASYFWSFLVALLLFFGGGVFSASEGVEKILHPEQVHHLLVGFAVLGISLVIETASLVQCLNAIHAKRGALKVMDYLRVTKDAELVVCTGENFAAVVGLGVAFTSMALAHWVDPRFDGLGSVLVGVVLVWVASFLARKVKSLLLGESADPEVEAHVRAAASEDKRIIEVLRVIAVQQGPGEVMIAAKLHIEDAITAADVVEVINNFEKRVRARLPDVKWQFIEPDLAA
ncbi:MAG: cation diffusion facilitator family transporter [Deltaproteobacteria bacterium]